MIVTIEGCSVCGRPYGDGHTQACVDSRARPGAGDVAAELEVVRAQLAGALGLLGEVPALLAMVGVGSPLTRDLLRKRLVFELGKRGVTPPLN